MTATPSPRGPTLRIVCINDVYSVEHLPALCNLVRHYAAHEPADRLLVTLAGDFVGPSMLSSLDKGRTMLECLNAIGVTQVIFGNHEDDVDLVDLRQRIAEFRGSWLNSNMPDFLPKLPSHEVITVAAPGGREVRVGLLGVVMADPNVYRRKPFGGFAVLPPNPAVLATAKELMSRERCTCVIPLTHQPIEDDRALAALPLPAGVPRFPVIIGGHEHEIFLEPHDGTWLVKAGADAIAAAIVDLSWPAAAPASGPDLPTVHIAIDHAANYPEDGALRALVNSRMAAVHELEAATLMQLGPGRELSSVGARFRQTSVGTLLCTRIREALGCDGCLLNGGGIRAGREYHQRFAYGDLKAELPFDNEISVVHLPGAVVREAIRFARAQSPAEYGGYLQVDDQMTVEEPSHLLTTLGGAAVDDARSYRIAIMRNLMTGMDHIQPLVQHAAAHPECLPAEGSGREIKVVLVDAFSVELWKALGSFDSVDTDHDGNLSESEIAAAVSRVTAEPASKITVDLLLQAIDKNGDRQISRQEAAAQGIGIKPEK